MSNGKQNRKSRDRDKETGSQRQRQKGCIRQRYTDRDREIVTLCGVYMTVL